MKKNIVEAFESFASDNWRADLISPPKLAVAEAPEPNPTEDSMQPKVPGRRILASITAEGGLPPIITLSEWVQAESIPRELVEGVLHRGMKMILGGGAKTFKSWNLIDCGLSVSIGGEWMGFPCQQAQVLYINFELSPAFCQQRIREVVSHRGYTFAEFKDFHVWNLRSFPVEIHKFIELIEEKIRLGGYGLVIFDPIYKLLGGLSENSAEDVADLMNALDELTVLCGAAILFSHHFSKGNQSRKEAIDRVSGSGVWSRDPDTLMMLTRHKQENAYTISTILRNHPPLDDFVVQWEFPRMRRREDLNPAQLHCAARSPVFTPEQVLEVLRDAGGEGIATGEWKGACNQILGMSSSAFYNKLKILREDGRVLCVKGKNVIPGPALSPPGESAAALEGLPDAAE